MANIGIILEEERERERERERVCVCKRELVSNQLRKKECDTHIVKRKIII